MGDNWDEPLTLDTLSGCEPEIGRMLWLLEATRGRTKEKLAEVDEAVVSWRAPDGSSIGDILYHMALIEADWLYTEVLEAAFYPPDVLSLFPQDVRDEAGHLTAVPATSLHDHWQRLDAVRALVLAAFRAMTLADFHRLRQMPNYQVTPAWVLHHLIQHEAEHRGQLLMIKTLAEKQTVK